MSDKQSILVIKLSALGDFIQALGPMRAIRQAHKEAHITLLTSPAFAQLGRDCGYFDDVWIDARPKWYQLAGWADLSRRLNQAGFERVYDLQNNDRTRTYFRLLRAAHRPEWVGTAPKGSHYNGSQTRTSGTAFAGHVETLALAGIKDIAVDQLEWMKGDISKLELSNSYALLVPGSAANRPEKRWPAERYSEIAQRLVAEKIQPVLIGTKSEAHILSFINSACAGCLDLTGKTDLTALASLARGAKLCVGNDTGPLHIIGTTGCPSVVLFSQAGSNPDKHAPLGRDVTKIVSPAIDDIDVDTVWQKIQTVI